MRLGAFGPLLSGLSLLLQGLGDGNFRPVWPSDSGIVLPFDTRRVIAADMNRDGRTDLVFASNNGPIRVLLRVSQN